MQKEIKLTDLKTLLISAKNELNSMLSLNRTKKIKYEEQQYFELVSFLSLWNAAGENGSEVMNIIDDVPSGDALMQQLKKLDIKEVEEHLRQRVEKMHKLHHNMTEPQLDSNRELWLFSWRSIIVNSTSRYHKVSHTV